MDILEEGSMSVQTATNLWYYKAKYGVVCDSIGTKAERRTLADVGCGMGVFLHLLIKSGWSKDALTGVDIAIAETKKDKEGGFLLVPRMPEEKRYDVILMMDVLEHCPDDLNVLKEAVDHLSARGRIMITVPAFQWLWSSHDVFLKHYRRYTLGRLKELIQKEGRLKLVHGHYFYGLLFPIMVFSRFLSKLTKRDMGRLKPLPGIINDFLTFICRFERFFMRFNRLAGLTVVAVCDSIRK
jgi:SAM-dependent methyltransferase